MNACNFFNDVDIQLILEFKNIFGKYQLVFPKNPENYLFLGHPVYIYIFIERERETERYI